METPILCTQGEDSSMRHALPLYAPAFALAVPAVGWACQLDTDCRPGSKCIKPQGSINGWCLGGLKGSSPSRVTEGSRLGSGFWSEVETRA